MASNPQISDRERAGLRGPVRTVSEDSTKTEYDLAGRLIIQTIYNERDQPTETQALDADGRLLSRILRAYDEKGRITDIRTMIEDPTSPFSEKQMADLIAQAGVSRDEMRAQLKKAFDVLTGKMGKSYTDDSQGRRRKIVLHQASPGDVSRTYAFNDLGDVVEEQTLLTPNPRIPAGVVFHLDEAGTPVPESPASEWPPQPEFPSRSVHHRYQYDRYGNWIEQTVSCSDSPPYTRRREHTYY